MKYFCDGYLRGSNPSYSGGYTVFDESGLVETKVIEKDNLTNNEVELRSIARAVELSQDADIISTDSMTCLSWIRSGKVKARPDLKPLVRALMVVILTKKLNLMWEGREYNLAGLYNDDQKLDTARPRKSKQEKRSNKIIREIDRAEYQQQLSFLTSL